MTEPRGSDDNTALSLVATERLKDAEAILRMLVEAVSHDKLEDFSRTSNVADMAGEFLKGNPHPTIVLPPPAPVSPLAAPLFVPNEAMLNAARDWSNKKYGKPIGNEAAEGCWQAMYTALYGAATPSHTLTPKVFVPSEEEVEAFVAERDALPPSSTAPQPVAWRHRFKVQDRWELSGGMPCDQDYAKANGIEVEPLFLSPSATLTFVDGLRHALLIAESYVALEGDPLIYFRNTLKNKISAATDDGDKA